MLLLVTGGAGFIGSCFIRYALKAQPGWKVINLDKLTYAGNLDNLRDVEEREGGRRYFFVRGDICDSDLVDSLLGGRHAHFSGPLRPRGSKNSEGPVRVIVHFAAESHVDRSIQDASPFYRTNVEGTRVLVETARRCWKDHGLKPDHSFHRLIHISTDEVYGALGSKESPFKEEHPLRPGSPYAASKAASDLLVLAYVHTYGLPAIITRCGNNYGPYQYPEKFIPLFITNALEDRALPLYGDGLQVRDWIHVEDHCQAILRVLEGGKLGDIYNIGAGEERTNLGVARFIVESLGKPYDFIESVPDRPGHDRRYALDCSKIRRTLGWKPKYTFEEGLTETIRWYRERGSWWKHLKNEARLIPGGEQA